MVEREPMDGRVPGPRPRPPRAERLAPRDMRTDPREFSPETRAALVRLKSALAAEPHLRAAQVTFDGARASDIPPVIDVLWDDLP